MTASAIFSTQFNATPEQRGRVRGSKMNHVPTLGRRIGLEPDIRIFSKMRWSEKYQAECQPLGIVFRRGEDPILDQAAQPYDSLLDNVGWNAICTASDGLAWLIRHHKGRCYISVLYQVNLDHFSQVLGRETAAQRSAYCEQITVGVSDDEWSSWAIDIIDAMYDWIGSGRDFQRTALNKEPKSERPQHDFLVRQTRMPVDPRFTMEFLSSANSSVRLVVQDAPTPPGPRNIRDIVGCLSPEQLKSLDIGAGWKLPNMDLDIQLYAKSRLRGPSGRKALDFHMQRFEARCHERACPSVHYRVLLEKAATLVGLNSSQQAKLLLVKPGITSGLPSDIDVSGQILALDTAIDLAYVNQDLLPTAKSIARSWITNVLRIHETLSIEGFGALAAAEHLPSLFAEHLKIDGVHLTSSLWDLMERCFQTFSSEISLAVLNRLAPNVSAPVTNWADISKNIPHELQWHSPHHDDVTPQAAE